MKVTTNRRKPCDSAHELTVTISQPQNIKPLTISLPYPFLVDHIHTTLHRKDRTIILVLKKGLLEPWSCEFQSNYISKWIQHKLKPWKGIDINSPNSLGIHLGTQFDLFKLPQEELFPLNQVRNIIKSLFIYSAVNGLHTFRIRQKGSSPLTDHDWYVRAHPPVRTSPTGSPVLMLSAVDHRLAQNMENEGKLDGQKAADDFFRIMMEAGNGFVNITMDTQKEAELFRFILRLNSTKVLPSAWQSKNILLGEDSPWIATFVSPLYVDSISPAFPSVAGEVVKTPTRNRPIERSIGVKDKVCCAVCKKIPQNLKRCSRCRSVSYCSAECQRADWALHKSVCTPLK